MPSKPAVPGGVADDDGLLVTGMSDPALLQEAAQLYREVFGYTDPAHGVNPRLLSALAANGGSVVGVLTPDGHVVMQERQERQRSIWVTTSSLAGLSFSSMSLIR